MAIIDGMLQELEHEAQTTRRVLERVPDEQLTWRPHAKARTLGELALHVATVPGGVAAARVAALAGAGATIHRPEPGQRRGAGAGARREHREGKRCSAAWTMRR